MLAVPDNRRLDASASATVAIVEDDAIQAMALALEIERSGNEVAVLGNGDDLVANIMTRNPRLVLLDLSLGRHDGIEVMRGLAQQRYSGIVLLMSGCDLPTLQAAHAIGVRLGLLMAAPMQKPVSTDAVRSTLRGVLPAQPESPTLLIDVQEAIDRGWLEVWYQPKVNLRRRILSGAEALVRLRHPQLGIVPPSAFVPSSTSNPYDVMTGFVFEAIARDWKALGAMGTKLPIAMNASIRLIERPQFLQMLTDTWPTMAERLNLIVEVTEDEVISDLQLARDSAVQLKLHGAKLSIDDFGTGYSTFARLRDLPCDEIKLDRSFVEGCSKDTRQRALCEAVVSLAREFGVSPVAEGVEGKADCDTLTELGFESAQGFYFARPLPFAQFRELLRRRRPKRTPAQYLAA